MFFLQNSIIESVIKINDNVSLSDKMFNNNEFKFQEVKKMELKQRVVKIEMEQSKMQTILHPGYISQVKSGYKQNWEKATPEGSWEWIKSDPVIKSVSVVGTKSVGVIVDVSEYKAVELLMYYTPVVIENSSNVAVGVGVVQGLTEYATGASPDVPSLIENPYSKMGREITNVLIYSRELIKKEFKKETRKENLNDNNVIYNEKN